MDVIVEQQYPGGCTAEENCIKCATWENLQRFPVDQ